MSGARCGFGPAAPPQHPLCEGLEFVELAVSCDEEFGIAVPDEVLQSVVTVGDFYDAILPLVRDTGMAELRGRPDVEEYVWSRVQALAAEAVSGVRPNEITRATRFVKDLGYG